MKLKICELAGGGDKRSGENNTPGKPHHIVSSGTHFVLGKCPNSL